MSDAIETRSILREYKAKGIKDVQISLAGIFAKTYTDIVEFDPSDDNILTFKHFAAVRPDNDPNGLYKMLMTVIDVRYDTITFVGAPIHNYDEGLNLK